MIYRIKSRYSNTRAKNVTFGIAYGRGANALVRQAKGEGVDATREEMQLLIDNFYKTFPRVKEYVASCHEAIRSPGYVENAYGRRRHFGFTADTGILKAKERQAQNAPKHLEWGL